ncbi:cytochrome b6/f complex subunit PetM [Micromonas pusilla CCMP1545]|uniref:Cytochrome b6/f complex subunit PetM n=1 Tax=Micromonas pusilla (strain CCMP1545) TaxID=564608 RepID=C1MY13_MICPC|nr:cytochrome b6/f complex subunit PetM [Micromonas pusilla CCMP1545]EEH55253.1 cytochrome b6/f complex subunit PetM [Micromonas pusilla CCMP1545]|eukprot:XP_003060484.1 cytochrome b6/f complex subunit PetM [Micromonas pusilla CCMP1545]
MAALTVSTAALAPVVARASVSRRSAKAVRATGLNKSASPAFSSASATAPRVVAKRGEAQATNALPLAEIAAVGPEIAEVATTCFAITLVGLAIGFVLLRVEAAVAGEE